MDAREVLRGAVLVEHALSELDRRGLDLETARQALLAAEQVLDVRPGRVVVQSRVTMGPTAKTYLLRIFPAEVVTAYRTSKIPKYRRTGP